MTRQTGGTKRSSWLTFRRRLLLVRLLLRSPASSTDLIAAVQAELGDEGYPPAASSALKHDFDALVVGAAGSTRRCSRPSNKPSMSAVS
jgi:hypothetical protein